MDKNELRPKLEEVVEHAYATGYKAKTRGDDWGKRVKPPKELVMLDVLELMEIIDEWVGNHVSDWRT